MKNIKMILLRALVIILFIIYIIGYLTIIIPIFYWVITGNSYADTFFSILDIIEGEYKWN